MKKSNPDKKIKVVLFDLGKVILDFNFIPAFHKLSRWTSLSVREIEAYFWRSGLEVLYDGGKYPHASFIRKLKAF